jgi:hypothetical protein
MMNEARDPANCEIIFIYDDDNNVIGAYTVIIEEDGSKRGTVVFDNDPNDPNDNTGYEYWYFNKRFYVWIDGQWVKMPLGWAPGKEIPPLI